MTSGGTTCEEHVERALAKMREYDRSMNAFITVFDRGALSRARELDSRLSRGQTPRPGPLYGVPVSIKDNIFVAGIPCTNGSKSFEGFIPAVGSDILDHLLEAGCIPVGKTNMHELALGATGTSAYGGPIRNPSDDSRISGGSSGGSAVSVALSEGAFASLGSDTGGSVRIPAALCGVCGFKPSLGLMSTVGVFPLSGSLDHLGLFARTMPDLSLFFEGLSVKKRVARAGGRVGKKKEPEEQDDGGVAKERRAGAPPGDRRLRLGVPSSYFLDDMDRQVSKNFWRTVDLLRARAEVVETRVEDDLRVYARARATITLREGAWFYEKLLRTAEDRRKIHADVLSLMDRGLRIGMIDYMRALNLRVQSIYSMGRLLNGLDALVMPTSPIVAPSIEETLGSETGRIRSLLLRNTELFNMCGLPALSVPTNPGGPSSSSLPTSIQVVGRFGDDPLVLWVGGRIWQVLNPRRHHK